MNEDDRALAPLFSALKQAIDARDATAESVARVNIACAYLQLESPQALPAFEEALAAVRRAQNPRSEGLLSIAFAPYFVEIGDPARALELAQRGEELARRGRRGHRILSLIQLARVLYTGFADPEQAGKAVDLALAALVEGEIAEPTDRQFVIQAAGQAALAAVQAGDVQRALALTRVVDPATAARLEQQRPQTATGLSAGQRNELTALYGKWRLRFASGKAADARLAELNRKATEILHWDQAKARRSGNSGDAAAVCAFVEHVHGIASGAQSIVSPSAAQTSITDDDLVFTVALATDRSFSALLPAWAVFELAGYRAKDRALAGRCLRLAGALGGDERDPNERLKLFQKADAALADGADDRLRAEVVNEIAVCELNLRKPQLAFEAATRASTLAAKCGDQALNRMARGNVANALLGMQKVAEALQIFETLARDQAAAGERDMADITRQNIEACRAYLRQHAGRR